MPDVIAGVVAIGFVILWIYCIYDVVTTPDAIARHLPKLVWLMIVILLPDVGSLLWLGLGRPRVCTRRAHESRREGLGRSVLASGDPSGEGAVDDLHPVVREREERARLRMWEAQLRRREEEIRRRLGNDPGR
jgi:hypothetical protein